MRLLVLSHSCVTPVNQQIFSALARVDDWDITLLAPSNWVDDYGALRGLTRDQTFQGKLRPIPVWLSGNVPLHAYKSLFISILNEEQPDAIFVHHEPYATATAQMYLANALSIQQPIGFFSWQNIFKTYPIPFRWMEKWVFRESDFAFPGSRSAEQVLRKKGYNGPTALLPGSVDTNIYQPYPMTETPRHALLGKGDGFLIGYVGRIDKVKGLLTLVAALSDLPKSLNWRLVLVGTGSLKEEIELRARHHGIRERIIFTGYVPHDETPRYLSAFDVVVLPSETQENWKEQFGRVLVEALACNTAVIGSDSGEIPNVIRDTQGGLVFPEGDSAALSEQLMSVLTNSSLRNTLSTRGRQKVINDYNSDALASRVSALIRLSLEKRKYAPSEPAH